ncbi:MAG: hypothetical protein ACTS41_01655 [Candidatus Hodgkinia cicadicola]
MMYDFFRTLRSHSFRLIERGERVRFINFRRGEGKLVPRGLAKFNVSNVD